MAPHTQQSNVVEIVIGRIFVDMMEISPLNALAYYSPFLSLMRAPRGDGKQIIWLTFEDCLFDPVTPLKGPTRGAVIGPVGLPERIRVVPVERWEVFLNPLAQIIVLEKSRINNRKSEFTSVTWIVVINIEDLAISPLFWIFRF